MILDAGEVLTLYALYRLDLVGLDEIRRFCIDHLEKSSDNELLQVAICDENDRDCLTKSTSQLFGKFGLLSIGAEDVLRVYASYVSRQIIDRAISPLEGADLIAKAVVRSNASQFHELDTFRYAASEAQDRPQDRQFFEGAIIDEAAVWSAREGELRPDPVNSGGTIPN